MNKEILLNAECSICLETYQSPIRILPCGHSFCESCLENLPNTSQQRISCPKCRRIVLLESGGLSTLPRNHDLENAIENLEKIKIPNKQAQNPCPIMILTGKPFIEYREHITSLFNNGEYHQAVQALPTIINNQKGVEKVFPMIDKAICQIEIGQKEAADTAIDIVSLVKLKATTIEMDLKKKKVFDKLMVLIEKFVKLNYIKSGLSLANCLVSLIENVYKDRNQLIKFERIGLLIQNLAKDMIKQNKHAQIKQFYSLFDRIFDYMQNLNNVDLKFKCKQIVWFLKYYGVSCNYAKDYSKSELIHCNAIVLMEAVFGFNAEQNRVLGYCFHNLGVSYSDSHQAKKAKAYYQKAINAFNQANDFPNERNKQTDISRSFKNLQSVEK